METLAPPGDHRFDASGTLVVDETCRRCGYNLRGLHRDGRCPECGSPVGLSIKGDLLRYADPSWLDRLARGSKFILNGLSVALLAAIALAVVTGMAASTTSTPSSAETEVAVGVCSLVVLLGMVAFYVGVWLMTSPDPTRVGEDQYATSRKLVRITLLIGVGDLALKGVLEPVSLPQSMHAVLEIVIVLTTIGTLIGSLAYLKYLGKLALRIPDHSLSKRARFLFSAFIVVPVGWVVLMLVCSIPGSTTLGSSPILTGGMTCVSLAIPIVMLVFVLMALRLQYRIGQACREQARIARETWALAESEQPPGSEPPAG